MMQSLPRELILQIANDTAVYYLMIQAWPQFARSITAVDRIDRMIAFDYKIDITSTTILWYKFCDLQVVCSNNSRQWNYHGYGNNGRQIVRNQK